MTTNQQVEALQNFLDKHQRKFASDSGKRISATWIKKHLAWLVPELATADPSQTRDIYAFLKVQSKLNRVLAQRGMYIKTENYYQWFRVLSAEATSKKVKSYLAKSRGNKTAANRLSSGLIRHKAKWSRLNTAETKTVERIFDVPVTRATY